MANYDINTAPIATLTDTTKLYVVGKQHTTPAALRTQLGAVTPAQLSTEQARILALETSQTAQDVAIAAAAPNSTIDVPKWDATISYTAGKYVSHLGLIYLSNAVTVAGENPVTTPTKWDAIVASIADFNAEVTARTNADLLLTPLANIDAQKWDAALAYAVGDRVSHLGLTYTCAVITTAGQSPVTTPASWTPAIDIAPLNARVTALESRDLEIGGTIRSGNYNGVLGTIEPVTTSAGNAICLPPATGTLTDGAEFGTVLYGTPGVGFTATIDFITRGQTVHGRADNIVITDEITPVRVRWSATHASWFIVS